MIFFHNYSLFIISYSLTKGSVIVAAKKDNYEGLIKELEEVVTQMENGELSLDKSMDLYEKGIKLSNKIYKILNDAEGKIKIFTEEGEKNFLQEEKK
ncbi:exodeoxyribonuclease VII small subunit [Clostridium tetani]|uniref:Exodeoxyribonuclease 7 small subunit n=1 Tax=Clostridium tetani TaxID=1513 RepID=A0A4V1LEU3_CLOTA|nr:exodeoxyribonuclease VII small subunit [Clostridium tetani]RXI46019.1 exodeoxyribonuclease VII small subunit [Clostridium tetani]RXI49426.1 exodeoxyribonuclease VII small subunit [Clostridium tetani]RXI50876.1 exodeoxyribonuclease VII small subunit [Clostridium tetani]RXI51166.1 exodeoxyribonuclease VII small subunit [Clostridium tetani]